jgi:sporulation protein YlmC with PRC-barrel domain
MTRNGTFIGVLAILSSMLVMGALVQDGRAAGQEPPSPTSEGALLRSSTLFSYRVKSPQGEDIGKIEEVMIDMEVKRVAYAVPSFGGFWGLGDKWVPVPWDALTFKPDEKVLVLNLEKEKLQKAPNFERATLPELANRQWGAVIHTYYGYPPYWEKRP